MGTPESAPHGWLGAWPRTVHCDATGSSCRLRMQARAKRERDSAKPHAKARSHQENQLKFIFFLSVAFAFLVVLPAMAQDPPPPPAASSDAQGVAQAVKQKKFPVDIHGFLLGDIAIRTTGERPLKGEGGDFVLGEGGLRLDISGATGSGKSYFLVKGDIFHDAIAKKFEADLREG